MNWTLVVLWVIAALLGIACLLLACALQSLDRLELEGKCRRSLLENILHVADRAHLHLALTTPRKENQDVPLPESPLPPG